MAKLTKLQLSLLQAAVATSDGSFPKPVTQKDEVAIAALVKQGLAISNQNGRQEASTTVTQEGRMSVEPVVEQQLAPAAAEKEPQPLTASAEPIATGKIGLLVDMLRRPEGARLDELTAATGWQPHSVRGALSGTIKKKLGLSLASEACETGRIYRIVETAA